MRFIGLLTKDGMDPFSLVHELDAFWREHQVQPEEPLLMYGSDPNAEVVKCWGKMRHTHVVAIPDGQNMVKDFVAILLVAESTDLPPSYRDAIIQGVVEDANEAGVAVSSLICNGCPA